jgi:glycosyltransferase involved in cell wall biosynthesis
VLPKLQIIYLHPHFVSDGGAGRMVLETAERLADRGHDVHVVCIRADSGIVGQLRDKVPFHEVGGPLSSSLFFWLRFGRSSRAIQRVVDQIVSRNGPHKTVLFPQVFPANWWGAEVLKHRPELACVWYCHEPSAFIHSDVWKRSLPWPKNWIAKFISPFMQRLDQLRCLRFSKILVNSDFSRHSVFSRYGYVRDACRTVYLGVNHERFRPDDRVIRKPWITVVAKLTRFKNVDVIIRAVGELVKRGHSQLCLNVVGVGDALSELQQIAVSEGIADRVEFHGRLPDQTVVELLQQSRVFCLASSDEPFGLVVVESLACGTPVVAMDSGGPREILSNLPCGKLCTSVDASQIADAAEYFLTMPEESFQLVSQSATQRATEFSWDNASLQIEAELKNSVLARQAEYTTGETS